MVRKAAKKKKDCTQEREHELPLYSNVSDRVLSRFTISSIRIPVVELSANKFVEYLPIYLPTLLTYPTLLFIATSILDQTGEREREISIISPSIITAEQQERIK